MSIPGGTAFAVLGGTALSARKSCAPIAVSTLERLLSGGAMFTALLLPLLLTGTPSGAAAQAASRDDPAIQIWINNDRRFVPGEQGKVQVRTREDGYLL